MSLGNCHFATDKNTFYIREIAFGDFRLYNRRFTPFRIKDAQYATPSSLITAHKVGVLNEKRCKSAKV
jgi:hypothetical protein